MKDTYYFSHDYEPTADPKIQALLGEYGAEGYGIYWRLVEMMHSDEDNQIPFKEYVYLAIAKQMVTTVERVKAIVDFCIDVCELFKRNDNGFYSDRVIRNVEKRKQLTEQRIEAGKASAKARKKASNRSTTVEQPLNETEQALSKTQQTKLNKTKGKEIKEENKKESSARDDKSPRAGGALEISFNFQSGKYENLSDSNIDYWQEQYPAIDVKEELRKTEAWLFSNPKNRKSNYKRFINGWLNKAQDKARTAKKPDDNDYLTSHKPYIDPGREDTL